MLAPTYQSNGITAQKNNITILTAVRTSNPTMPKDMGMDCNKMFNSFERPIS
jgi:hypothetical protein